MRNRRLVLAGFTPALALGLLCGLEWLLANRLSGIGGEAKSWLAIVSQTAVFGLPTLLLCLPRTSGKRVDLRLRPFSLRLLPFVTEFAFAVSLLSFVLNYLVALLWKSPDAGGQGIAYGGVWLLFVASVFAPALFEELYLRGALFSVFEECGTVASIVFTALVFAMMHGSLRNFAGPLVAGMAYAYMAFITDSLFAAMLAHLLNNLLAVIMERLMTTYAAFGLWSYFLLFCILLFFVFCTMALRGLEKLVARGRVPRFRPAPGGMAAALFETLLSPGFVLFAAVYVMKLMLE